MDAQLKYGNRILILSKRRDLQRETETANETTVGQTDREAQTLLRSDAYTYTPGWAIRVIGRRACNALRGLHWHQPPLSITHEADKMTRTHTRTVAHRHTHTHAPKE